MPRREAPAPTTDLPGSTGRSSGRPRSVLVALGPSVGVSWLTMIAMILVMANEVAMPLDFVIRPIAVAFLPAFVIGVVATPLGRFAALGAVVLSPLVVIPALWPWAAGLVFVELVIWLIGRRFRSTRFRSAGSP